MNKYFSFGIFVIVLVGLASFFVFWQSGNQNNVENVSMENESQDFSSDILNVSLDLELVEDRFVSPVDILQAPDDSGRLFVVDRIGEVKIIDSNGILIAKPFIDISDRMIELNNNYDERGLLGMDFHPNFVENGKFYLHYSAPLDSEAPQTWDHTGIISEFSVSSDENDADEDSERIIFSINQPQMNHNGGQITFGPDGYLYVGLGDGGNANDVGEGHPAIGNGQNKTTLLGSILRIDVDTEQGYVIPSDNPFVGSEGRDEIYAYGLRNPYKFSFDGNDLYVADVGQNLWEEINLVQKGNNYGWNIMEGSYCFDKDEPDSSLENCNREGLELPIIEYSHEGSGVNGLAVIGGYIYRGDDISDLNGNYVFADWSNEFAVGRGKILIASNKVSGWEIVDTLDINEFILSLGRDNDGEIYVLTTEALGPIGSGGKVYKIVEK